MSLREDLSRCRRDLDDARGEVQRLTVALEFHCVCLPVEVTGGYAHHDPDCEIVQLRTERAELVEALREIARGISDRSVNGSPYGYKTDWEIARIVLARAEGRSEGE